MVGAGVIGIEYASIFAALGVAVTLVERRERPLEFLDREIVDELIHQMRNRNVTFRLGEAVESHRRSPTARRARPCCTSSPASGSSPTWCSSRPAASRPPTP